MIYEFLVWCPEWLRFPMAALMLLAVVPLAGVCTFGNWKQAKAYTLIWSKVVGGMVLAASFIALLLL
jgi:hypothetical protein